MQLEKKKWTKLGKKKKLGNAVVVTGPGAEPKAKKNKINIF